MNVDVAIPVLTGLALLVVILTRPRPSACTDSSGVARVPQDVVKALAHVGMLVAVGAALLAGDVTG